jgi:beta-lactam-binding protein with PASTA domain
VTEVVRCRSCGTDNEPGRDFCERCGEYLAWAPTTLVSAVSGAAAKEAMQAREQEAAQGAQPAGPTPTEESPTVVLPAQRGSDGDEDDEAAAPEPPPQPADTLQAPQAAAAPAAPAPAGRAPGDADGAQPPAAAAAVPPAAPPPPAAAAAPPQAAAAPPPPPPPPPSVPVSPREPVHAPVPEAPRPTGEASLVLAPAVPALGLAGVPAVEAGGVLSFVATIRNESQIVDNYDLAVLGLPENWATVSPTAAFLVPLGSGRGESELDLRIDISPPRDYRSTAGIWTIELVALSRTHGTLAARAIADFEVRPFQAWSIEAVPVINSGRLKARYRTAVRNDGNDQQILWPTAIDESGKLRRKFARGRLVLAAGEVGTDTLTLRPRFPKPVGRVTEHRVGVDVLSTEPAVDESQLSMKERARAKAREEAKKTGSQVKVDQKGVKLPKLPKFKNPLAKLKLDASALSRLRSGDANAPTTATQIVFRQKPLIPLWVIGVIVLAAVAAVVIYLLWPQKTTVPPLIGVTDSFVAEKRLREEGLVLSRPIDRRPDPNAVAGSIIEQSPVSGSKVDEGSSVSIVVADGEAKVEVPRLQGLTRVEADKRLRGEGLELGTTAPEDAPDSFVVRSQIPAAALRVDLGTAVRVFLRKPALTAKEKKAAAKKKAAAAAAAKKKKEAAAKAIKIPAIDDAKLAEYIEKLEKLGLKAKVSRAVSARPSGTVIAVKPKPGEEAEKGDEVSVRASGGLPPLAVETDTPRVLVVNPVGGKELFRLPLSGGVATEASFLPGGQRMVYRTGSRLQVTNARKGSRPSNVYAGPDDLRHPSVAPDGTRIAVIRREEGDGDLCFGRLDVADLGQLCLPDDGWDLNGRISWRADGLALLVPGRRRDNPAVFAIRVYRSSKRLALDPLDFHGSTATSTRTPGKGVRAMSYSASGTQIAAVSNLESDAFEVVLSTAGDLRLAQPQATKVKACDVAWRPDGHELAAVQVDDGCTKATGKIVRFARAKPEKTSPVVDKGRNPTYRAGG